MKKIIPLLFGFTALLSNGVQADILGLQVGASSWKPDYTGTFANGDVIDIGSDLGYGEQSHQVLWAKFEHPVPVMPNFRISSNDLDAAANSTLTRSFNYSGQPFSPGNVSSQFDMTNTEVTLYYELLDNWVNFDLGLTVRQYDGQARIDTASTAIDFSIPLLYAEARFDLPFTGFFIDTSMNGLSVNGNSITETAIGLGYESSIGFGAKLGVRSLDLQFDEAGLSVDLSFEGAYADLFFHF